MKTLGDFVRDGGRDNNFNLMRLGAAVLVLFSHSFALASGQPSDEPLRGILGVSLGTLSVDLFFVISGFLVTCSLLQRRNLRDFFAARFLRIYPALWIMVGVVVLFLGTRFGDTSLPMFLKSPDTVRFLKRNLTLVFGNYDRLGLHEFGMLPYPHAVNGSLWTMPFEIWMYLALASIWAVGGGQAFQWEIF